MVLAPLGLVHRQLPAHDEQLERPRLQALHVRHTKVLPRPLKGRRVLHHSHLEPVPDLLHAALHVRHQVVVRRLLQPSLVLIKRVLQAHALRRHQPVLPRRQILTLRHLGVPLGERGRAHVAAVLLLPRLESALPRRVTHVLHVVHTPLVRGQVFLQVRPEPHVAVLALVARPVLAPPASLVARVRTPSQAREEVGGACLVGVGATRRRHVLQAPGLKAHGAHWIRLRLALHKVVWRTGTPRCASCASRARGACAPQHRVVSRCFLTRRRTACPDVLGRGSGGGDGGGGGAQVGRGRVGVWRAFRKRRRGGG
eukprot:Rhum_TRINITY_DN2057_c0_g1::Rhum_TRINITY_DN2057_c0_g1_i1::g.5632::m.5632